jgi:hypothetical protein
LRARNASPNSSPRYSSGSTRQSIQQTMNRHRDQLHGRDPVECERVARGDPTGSNNSDANLGH